MSAASNTSVLIVGAGPTGLVLALSLLQNGTKVRVIEKNAPIYIGQRGSGIMPRTLELYRLLGVLPDILAVGLPSLPIKMCKAGSGHSGVLGITTMCPKLDPTPAFPYLNPIGLGQGRVQQILRDHIKKYGGEVEYNTELKGFDQYDDHVTARIVKTVDGEEVKEEVRADYLVGTDGTKGVVRKLLGLSFLGETREDGHWILADATLKNPPIDAKYWYIWGNVEAGLVAIIPTENYANNQYWVTVTGSGLDYHTLSTDRQAFADHIRKISGLPDLEFEEFLTLAEHKINVRMVDKFSQGRVFVAGDAAHAHSFTGGQGMNSSIQDAFNLGWKLALASKSQASSQLLESYSAERLPIIAGVLEKTTQVLNKTVAAKGLKQMSDTWTRGQEFYQLGMNYRGSTVVYDELESQNAERVTAGDRAPDAPALVPLTEGIKADALQLFDLFSPARHTAIVFPANQEDVDIFTMALQKYPDGAVRTVIVLAKGSEIAREQLISERGSGVDVVVDSEEHCWGIYPTSEGVKVVIVRPDGCVGAVTQTADGVEKYRDTVFDASA